MDSWIHIATSIDLFSKLCTISAFLPPSKALIRSIKRRKSEKFWRVRCDFVLLFGGAEMQAQIVCFEKVVDFLLSLHLYLSNYRSV